MTSHQLRYSKLHERASQGCFLILFFPLSGVSGPSRQKIDLIQQRSQASHRIRERWSVMDSVTSCHLRTANVLKRNARNSKGQESVAIPLDSILLSTTCRFPCTGIETTYIMAGGGRHRKESRILQITAAEKTSSLTMPSNQAWMPRNLSLSIHLLHLSRWRLCHVSWPLSQFGDGADNHEVYSKKCTCTVHAVCIHIYTHTYLYLHEYK